MRSSRYRIDLVRQMADCDANFIRLLKLVPELESLRDARFEALGKARSEQENPTPAPRQDPQFAGAVPECECSEHQQVYAREFAIHSPAGDEVRIRISVLEVFRYTSTLAVSQLTRLSSWIEPPVILVRVYHDAATAEAIAYQGHKAFLARYAIPNPTMYHQDEKRQINEFLGEWLSLCLQAGHSLKTPMFICAA